MIARENLPSLNPSAAGVPPLDVRVETYVNDPRIPMFMLPMPLSHGAPKDEIGVDLKRSHVVADGDSPNPKKGPKKRKSMLKNHALKS